MEMTFEEKRDAAIEFLNKFSQMFDVNFTNEQRAFCIGYLLSMLDAAEQCMESTGPLETNVITHIESA